MDAIVYDKVGKEAEKVREALYGLYPQETITDAAIASFSDGADSMPIRKLVAQIEPVQDLHGYDHPWPAGGGKNKLALTDTSTSPYYSAIKDSDGNIIGAKIVRPASDAGQATVVIMPNTLFPAGDYIISASSLPTGVTAGIRGAISANINATNLETAFTLSAAGEIRVVVNLPDSTAVDFILYPMIRLATEADATFAPYSNICPISGWTGAEVTGTRKNLFNLARNNGTDGIYAIGMTNLNVSDQTLTFTATVSNPYYGAVTNVGEEYRKHYGHLIRLKKNTDYRVTITNPELNQILLSKYDKNLVSMGFSDVTNGAFNSGEAEYATLRIGKANAVAGTTYSTRCMVEEGTVATDYAPYTGNQISVTFPPESGDSGTVYGGTITLNQDRTGEMVVDRATVDMGTLNWVYQDNKYFRVPFPNGAEISGYGSNDFLCEIYRYGTGPDIFNQTADKVMTLNSSYLVGQGKYACVRDSAYTDAASFKAAMSGVQLCYPLASPQTYQLTAEQVSGILTTLYGQNNIWADTGNIKKLTYRADLGKYIDSHITTAVANALNA